MIKITYLGLYLLNSGFLAEFFHDHLEDDSKIPLNIIWKLNSHYQL